MIEVTLNLTTEQITLIAQKVVEISAANEPKNNQPEVFFTVKETAELLKISEQTVRKLIKEGSLNKAFNKGPVRISNHEIKRYAESV